MRCRFLMLVVVVLAVLGVRAVAQSAPAGGQRQEPSSKTRPTQESRIAEASRLGEGVTRAIVAVTLDRDKPSGSGIWSGTLAPEVRHVAPGEWLALVNLSYEKVRFTFYESIFEEPGVTFWVEPDQVKSLRVRPEVRIRQGERASRYEVWSEHAFRNLPGPNLRVP